MRSFFTILFCVFFSCLVNGQMPSGGREATDKEQKLFESSQDCVKAKSIPLTKRLKHYPFNNTNKIQLVSFKSSVDSTFGEYYKDSLPRKNDTICYSKLNEVKTLENSQLDSLTDIIYNYGFKFKYKGKRNVYFIGSVLQCYNPRNAILFLDKNYKVFEYIEICFECEKTRTSSDKVSLGIECNQKLQLVKKVFKDNGIKYGVTEN